jgi:hypothetical protein
MDPEPGVVDEHVDLAIVGLDDAMEQFGGIGGSEISGQHVDCHAAMHGQLLSERAEQWLAAPNDQVHGSCRRLGIELVSRSVRIA